MSESENVISPFTHKAPDTTITNGKLYKPGEHPYIKATIDNFSWEEDLNNRMKEEQERQEKLNMLAELSKEQIEALKILANNYILKDEIGGE